MVSRDVNVLGFYGGLGALVGAHQGGGTITRVIEPRLEFDSMTYLLNPQVFDNAFVTRGLIIKDFSRLQTVDISISSPPCKRFSALAVRKKDRLEGVKWDETEIYKLMSGLVAIQPDFIVIENLPRMADFVSFIEWDTWDYETAETGITFKLPYNIQMVYLMASQFGLPQRRRRLFWVCSGGQFKFNYTPPVEITMTPRCGPFLENCDDLPNMERPKHGAKRIDGFSKLGPGQSYYGTQNNIRLDVSKLAPAVTSHRTQHVHPYESRTLTVRENARLMGYPDDFGFFGPRTKQLDQVGMGVCPAIAKDIVSQIITCIGEKR